MTNSRKVAVSYTLRLMDHEWEGIVALADEYGHNHDNVSELKRIKRALRNSGESWCLAEAGDALKRKREKQKKG